METALKQHSA